MQHYATNYFQFTVACKNKKGEGKYYKYANAGDHHGELLLKA